MEDSLLKQALFITCNEYYNQFLISFSDKTTANELYIKYQALLNFIKKQQLIEEYYKFVGERNTIK